MAREFSEFFYVSSFKSINIVFETGKYHSWPNTLPFWVGYWGANTRTPESIPSTRSSPSQHCKYWCVSRKSIFFQSVLHLCSLLVIPLWCTSVCDKYTMAWNSLHLPDGRLCFCVCTIIMSIPSMKSGCLTVGSLSRYCLAFLSEEKCIIETVRFPGQRPSVHLTCGNGR